MIASNNTARGCSRKLRCKGSSLMRAKQDGSSLISACQIGLLGVGPVLATRGDVSQRLQPKMHKAAIGHVGWHHEASLCSKIYRTILGEVKGIERLSDAFRCFQSLRWRLSSSPVPGSVHTPPMVMKEFVFQSVDCHYSKDLRNTSTISQNYVYVLVACSNR